MPACDMRTAASCSPSADPSCGSSTFGSWTEGAEKAGSCRLSAVKLGRLTEGRDTGMCL